MKRTLRGALHKRVESCLGQTKLSDLASGIDDQHQTKPGFQTVHESDYSCWQGCHNLRPPRLKVGSRKFLLNSSKKMAKNRILPLAFKLIFMVRGRKIFLGSSVRWLKQHSDLSDHNLSKVRRERRRRSKEQPKPIDMSKMSKRQKRKLDYYDTQAHEGEEGHLPR